MKRKYSIVFTVVILGLVAGYFVSRPKFNEDTDQFGKSFNNERTKIGIPKIEENWVAHHPDSTGTTWMNISHQLVLS
jgi:hypothetical protein